MNSIVVRPEIPYYGRVPSNFESGSNITLDATTMSSGSRFLLSLQFISDTQTDVPIEITIDTNTDTISFNSSLNGVWNEPKTHSSVPLSAEELFTLTITCISNGYKILLNNKRFDYFLQENTFNYGNHFAICGEVKVQQITYTTEVNQNASINFEPNYDAPPPSYNEAVSNYSNNQVNSSSNFDFAVPPAASSPNPLPPTFVPPEAHLDIIQSPNVQEIFSSTSSNFRPVKPSHEKKISLYAVIILIIVLIIFASSVAKKKKVPVQTYRD